MIRSIKKLKEISNIRIQQTKVSIRNNESKVKVTAKSLEKKILPRLSLRKGLKYSI